MDHLLERMNHKFAEAAGREMSPINLDSLRTTLMSRCDISFSSDVNATKGN
jgi:hypothetical protein